MLAGVVYQDEGRGAFGPLKEKHGSITAETMMDLACRIPIKGGNVLNAVFDATALRLWVTYAGQDAEAYQRPFVFLDLTSLDGDCRRPARPRGKRGRRQHQTACRISSMRRRHVSGR